MQTQEYPQLLAQLIRHLPEERYGLNRSEIDILAQIMETEGCTPYYLAEATDQTEREISEALIRLSDGRRSETGMEIQTPLEFVRCYRDQSDPWHVHFAAPDLAQGCLLPLLEDAAFHFLGMYLNEHVSLDQMA